jgi:L-lactate dehydrogenase complex protein LldG
MPSIAPQGLIPKFEEELGKVSGCAHRAASPGELDEILANLLKSYETKRVVLSRNPVLVQARIPEKLQKLGITATTWPTAPGQAAGPLPAQEFRREAFAAEVGISGVDWVLAESGTLVLSSLTEGAQLASLAPPVHIALYRRNQVLASLEEVLERLPILPDASAAVPGRSIVFVTGVSRTADIEQILIRGVHGPRELHAILVEDSCLV